MPELFLTRPKSKSFYVLVRGRKRMTKSFMLMWKSAETFASSQRERNDFYHLDRYH
jgi:hypothetical protein